MSETAGLRVLLVEDEMLVGMLLEDFLCELGCVVIGPVTSLKEAVASAHDAQVDVALLDVNLAGADAFPVAEVLAGRDIPFAFLTGYRHPHGDSRFDGRPTLQKPVDKAVLGRVMAALDPRKPAR